MKSGFRSITISTGIGMIALAVLMGCAARNASLAGMGIVRVEVMPSRDDRVEISGADAYREGDELVVTGKAVRQGVLFASDKGHIDIAVIGPDESS